MTRGRARFPLLALGALTACLALSPETAEGQTSIETVALTGATVHPVSQAPIESGVVLIEAGRIAGVGTDLEIPEGAQVVDLAGRHVYPGLIHPGSVLGLTEISSVRGTVDIAETGNLNPEVRAEVAFHGDSELLPVTVSGGILTAHVVPRGEGFRGTSAVMRLDGWNWEDMLIRAGVGMHLSYPRLRPARRSFGPPVTDKEIEEKKEKALAEINRALDQAEDYARSLAAAADGTAPAVAHDPKLAALTRLLAGELPLFLHAEEKTQIESALEWADERGLENLVLVTGPDAAYLGDRLAEAGIPVVLNGVLRRPGRDWEPYDTAYTAAARLHEAGVSFAIGDGGTGFGAANSRNLPFHAAMAVAFGLPKDVALRSITLDAARVLGIEESLGSLEAGKSATLIVTDGDPLEIRTRVVGAWIDGREIDLSADRQKRLFYRYNQRPRPAQMTVKPPKG